ncbi:hypothetical protein AU195_06615 [Mycobacterium sp. IS-1496]|nr:hypothetical protein AU195_06615 [Mycobacterium sp. IS-1496]
MRIALFSVNGLDAGGWGSAELAIGVTAALILVAVLLWDRTPLDLRWALPLAWLAVVLGVACLSFSIPTIVRIMTIPTQSVLGLPISAEIGWGLVLHAVSAAVLVVATHVATTRIASDIEASYGQTGTIDSWIRLWRRIAVAASLLVVAGHIIYFSLQWERSSFVEEQSSRNTDVAALPTSRSPSTTEMTLPSPTTSNPSPASNCGIDLQAPAVMRAIETVQPVSAYPLDPEYVWGNFDPCKNLTAALVPTAMGTGSSPVQALFFHYGDYVGSPTGAGFGYLRFNEEMTTDDTVVLTFRETLGSCGGCDDATWADVRFRLRDGELVALDRIPDMGSNAPSEQPSNSPTVSIPTTTGPPLTSAEQAPTTNLESACSDPEWRDVMGDEGDRLCGAPYP